MALCWLTISLCCLSSPPQELSDTGAQHGVVDEACLLLSWAVRLGFTGMAGTPLVTLAVRTLLSLGSAATLASIVQGLDVCAGTCKCASWHSSSQGAPEAGVPAGPGGTVQAPARSEAHQQASPLAHTHLQGNSLLFSGPVHIRLAYQ